MKYDIKNNVFLLQNQFGSANVLLSMDIPICTIHT